MERTRQSRQSTVPLSRRSRPAISPAEDRPLADTVKAAHSGVVHLTPADVQRLQRTVGNQAVSRLLGRAAAPLIQCEVDEKELRDKYVKWIIHGIRIGKEAIPRNLASVKTRVREELKSNGETLTKAAEAKLDEMIRNELLTPEERAESRRNVGEEERAAKRAAPLPAKLSEHVFKGEIEDARPKGFHSKRKAGEAVLEPIANSRVDKDFEGVYFERVKAKAGGAEKPDGSTFFPDAMTEDEIRIAINMRNSKNQVTEPARYAGMKLRIVEGVTAHPDYPTK